MKKLSMVAGLLLAGYAANSLAYDVTASMGVTTTVNTTCSIETQNLNFGPFDPSTAIGPSNGETSATVTALCTDATPYFVYLSAGNSASTSDFTTRYMISSTDPIANTDQVDYNIYLDSSYVNVWGDSTLTSSNYVTATGTGINQNYTTYGQIGAGQTSIVADSYVDSITVDLNY